MTLLVIDQHGTTADTTMEVFEKGVRTQVLHGIDKIATLKSPIEWGYVYDPDSVFHEETITTYTTMAMVGDYDLYCLFRQHLTEYTRLGVQEAARKAIQAGYTARPHYVDTTVYFPFEGGVLCLNLSWHGFYTVELLKGEQFVFGSASPKLALPRNPTWYIFMSAHQSKLLHNLDVQMKKHDESEVVWTTFSPVKNTCEETPL